MKKGFAISSMLYAMLVLFLIILFGVLYIIGNQTLIFNRSKKNIFNDLNGSNTRQVYQDKSGASYPNLAGGLIPVYYDNETSTWNKANVYEEWYDYDKKNWANAVLLDDNVILDVSGNSNHGYLQGAIRNDASVTTDGVDDYVYAGLPNYDFKDEFSIAIRVKFNQYVGNIFENAEGSGISIVGNGAHKLYLQVMNKTENKYVVATSDTEYSLNTWYTVVGTLKDSKLHLYINGKEATTPVSFNGEIKASTLALLIASNPQGSSCNTTNHTCTNVDPSALEFTDALIFDRALSENEIKYDYASKITNLSNTSKMVLRYDLDDEIKPDTPLPEEVIESHFVWIPKYRYKLWDLGDYSSLGTTATNKVREIQIEFDTEDTTDTATSCKTPMTSGNIGNCTINRWMTHPAFLSFDVDGFWVGKFETGYKGANSKTDAQIDSNNSDKIIIKPNVYGWRGIKVKNIFEASYNYERALDSHMIKNTEWGAIAYLSHSKYGIKQEINKNNNSKHLTGCGSSITSAASESCNDYTTDLGMGASTTGNIYGIYDLVGGTSEYIAAYLANSYGNSGFDDASIKDYAKYFDVYQNKTGSRSDYTGRILGDCIGEIGPFFNDFRSSWYDDQGHFLETDRSWLYRGGYYNDTTQAGQFKFASTDGGAKSDDGGFRITLSPQ